MTRPPSSGCSEVRKAIVAAFSLYLYSPRCAGGRLRVTRVQGRDLLPLNPAECADEARHRYCFSAGDLRCNEQLQLTVGR